jgi:SPASM domain peptide maturase of grasp-with-spasm system
MRYFNLFSDVLVTKGASRILISDLQRNISEIYPLELYDIIESLKHHSVEDLLKSYDEESQEIIHEYLDFFLEKEYGFFSQNDWDKNFLPLSYEYKENDLLSNIFIEMVDLAILHKIKSSIENLEIKHIIIFSKKNLSLDELVEIDNLFKNSPVSSIEIYSPYHSSINIDFIQNLNQNTLRFHNIVFYNCNQEPFKIIKNTFNFTLSFLNENLKISSCGKVSLDYFNTNINKVLEAINYNSCLYKKIGIDAQGNIKNCPSMCKAFGNIENTTLEEVLNKENFKKYWNITKDNIEVCKDCEFRYICTDCRAYTERIHSNEDGIDTSKPLKCGYDPYSGEWEEWSTNPLKQKAIKHYGL